MRKTQLPSMKNISSNDFLKDTNQLLLFRKNILDWYDNNQRDLPWRKNSSLYKTVLSEFMLQQTRVSTVIPYFINWLKKFPDFQTLANASEEEVLKMWEGLGYYSRARNLLKLSKILSSLESPPETVKEWMALPGVGPYIAAAVTSIAFDSPIAVCDGNLVRVLTRIVAIDEEFKDGAAAQKKLQPLAQYFISANRAGDHNQAMMELGATVCLPRSPLCVTCPVLDFCLSGQAGNAESFPKIQKRKNRKISIPRYWIESNGNILLETDLSSKKKLVGIYELPSKLPSTIDYDLDNIQSLGVRKRTIGNINYEEEILLVSKHKIQNGKLDSGYIWANEKKIREISLSGPHRKWINEISSSRA